MQHWTTESFGDVLSTDTLFKSDNPETDTTLLMTGDVFGVVPSEVNAVFDYTEYTRFGLWSSAKISSQVPADQDPAQPDVNEEQQDAANEATGRTTGRYAYSPLGNTGLGRADLPSSVEGSYEGYTYAYGADLTIYGGDLEITINWAVDADNDDADTTGIEVVISDLIDSDGMGWTDADDMEDTVDPIVTSITFGSQENSQLVAFSSETDMGNTLDAAGEAIDVVNEVAENVAGFNAVYSGTTDYNQVIKLVYDEGDEVYANGAINGQFLGVSAADSGNADQPRAIIGEWNIGTTRLTVEDTSSGAEISTTLTPAPASESIAYGSLRSRLGGSLTLQRLAKLKLLKGQYVQGGAEKSAPPFFYV